MPLREWLPFLCVLSSVALPIYPNAHWLDSDGSRIEAHAAGILDNPRDGRLYWYGETAKIRNPNDEGGVNCYSAPTIAGPWTFEGQVLTQEDITIPNANGPWIVERPKVLYNSATDTFVMWFHLDAPVSWEPSFSSANNEYIVQKAAVATAKNASGPFTFVKSLEPDGLPSLDLNLFQDPLDGAAYLLRDCGHHFVGISRLSPDYLSTTGIISKIPTSEGMAMFRLKNGTYYVLSSHLTGWNPNPMIAWRSNITSLDGAGWENLGNPTGNYTSFFSQPTTVFRYTPKRGRPYFVYVGDNWMHCGNATTKDETARLRASCYVWLPIKINGQKKPIEIKYREEWDLEHPWKNHHGVVDAQERKKRAVTGALRMHDAR